MGGPWQAAEDRAFQWLISHPTLDIYLGLGTVRQWTKCNPAGRRGCLGAATSQIVITLEVP